MPLARTGAKPSGVRLGQHEGSVGYSFCSFATKNSKGEVANVCGESEVFSLRWKKE